MLRGNVHAHKSVSGWIRVNGYAVRLDLPCRALHSFAGNLELAWFAALEFEDLRFLRVGYEHRYASPVFLCSRERRCDEPLPVAEIVASDKHSVFGELDLAGRALGLSRTIRVQMGHAVLEDAFNRLLDFVGLAAEF